MPVGTIQKNNWRTTEVQVFDDDGSAAGLVIPLTGATGFLISTDEAGVSYKTAIVLGKFPRPGVSSDPAGEAILGWCHATFKTVATAGRWVEQLQLVLPTGSEPLNGRLEDFNVSDNLTPP